MVTALQAARRPRYGGTLRVEMHEAVAGVEQAGPLASQIFETLIRIDERGEPQPHLAVSWTHDAQHKRWLFAARPRVMLHNGTLWDPPGGVIAVDDRKPIDEILRDLGRPESAIIVRATDGTLLGTGPFRITKWEPKKSLTLEAYNAYWGGRPYLDAIEIQMGRAHRDQALDLELGKTDVIELPVSEIRRVQQRGGKVVVSAPVETVGLQVDNGNLDALALSIDRTAIYNVLLQRQGEVTAALLPQWVTGYAFLFPIERNLARAKELAAGVPPLTFAYDRQTPLLRSIAERIILNAAEAGIVLRPPAGPTADVRLVTFTISDFAAILGLPDPSNRYEQERALIRSRRIIPLFHLPVAWQLAPNVHGWADEKLADAWLDQKGNP